LAKTKEQAAAEAQRIFAQVLEELMADKFGQRVITVKCRDGILSWIEVDEKKQHKLI